ncbi:NADH dehydrogenase subunit C [Peribacillus simplex]|uniref:NADH dehydrogenase subunit C n=1 Tax=Peribacillus simplex TaxID=1478 RepID=A0A9X8R9D4_9BACI|nr:NADH-quinone oxidoreductase subunit C [Peribacillus simplex]SIR34303.1 NADH dehydrogenase subunit C [Peribacillus simplex]
MSEKEDLAKQKAEAAAKAKAEALARKQAKAESAEKPEGEMDLAKQKAEAAAKAKAEALARKQAKAESAEKPEGEMDIAKQKAEAAAKAKAAALARKRAKEEAAEKPEGEMDIAKQKAEAAAKAKAAALARKRAKEEAAEKPEGEMDIAKQKAAAAAKAKAAAAAAKNRTVKESEEVNTPSELSPNQSKLDQIVSAIESHVGQGALLEHYINRLSKDVPTLLANPDTYFSIAKYLRYDEQLNFSYLSELHGTDFETHMEIYVHLHSFKMNQSVALKVKLDRDSPVIPSLVPLWSGANWPECEAYDLLGINFYEHPDLKRILLGEDWKGYPLRKDYQPYDVEV